MTAGAIGPGVAPAVALNVDGGYFVEVNEATQPASGQAAPLVYRIGTYDANLRPASMWSGTYAMGSSPSVAPASDNYEEQWAFNEVHSMVAAPSALLEDYFLVDCMITAW